MVPALIRFSMATGQGQRDAALDPDDGARSASWPWLLPSAARAATSSPADHLRPTLRLGPERLAALGPEPAREADALSKRLADNALPAA
jgi:hypothetical protein